MYMQSNPSIGTHSFMGTFLLRALVMFTYYLFNKCSLVLGSLRSNIANKRRLKNYFYDYHCHKPSVEA